MKFQNLVGQTFTRLTVVELVRKGKRAGVATLWKCQCECGNTITVRAPHLKNGNTKSCGCLRDEVILFLSRTHGATAGRTKGEKLTPEYTTWLNMKYRCTNPKCDKYQFYGGRGITVCERWLRSYAEFFADVGPRPSPLHSLDRINNDSNYEPDNVRWATKVEQTVNRRKRSKFNPRDDAGKFIREPDGSSSTIIGAVVDKLAEMEAPAQEVAS